MITIPPRLTLTDVQSSFREVQSQLQLLLRQFVDLNGRRIGNAGEAIAPFDYVRKYELDMAVKALLAQITKKDEGILGLLNSATGIRRGVYAARGPAAPHAGTLFLATDRDYIGFFSTGAIWVYAFGLHRAAIADRPTPTADEVNYPFYATDTFALYFWSGVAWAEDILTTIERFGGTTSSFPAIKRSAAILQARLADDSAHTDIEVADEAYNATTWNASLEVPTKNAVRDKIETLLGSSAYTPTNVTPDRSYDADTVLIAELADVVGTLIADLQGKGILS